MLNNNRSFAKRQKFWVPEIISSIPSDVEKFADFDGEITFQIQPNIAELYQKTGSKGPGAGIRKALKCTITPVIYNASARSRWQIHNYTARHLRRSVCNRSCLWVGWCVCGRVCGWVCYHDNSIACIDPHQTGFV